MDAPVVVVKTEALESKLDPGRCGLVAFTQVAAKLVLAAEILELKVFQTVPHGGHGVFADRPGSQVPQGEVFLLGEKVNEIGVLFSPGLGALFGTQRLFLVQVLVGLEQKIALGLVKVAHFLEQGNWVVATDSALLVNVQTIANQRLVGEPVPLVEHDADQEGKHKVSVVPVKIAGAGG